MGYFPQVIFIDSISLDMSNLDRPGTRWPGLKASSVPLKPCFEKSRPARRNRNAQSGSGAWVVNMANSRSAVRWSDATSSG